MLGFDAGKPASLNRSWQSNKGTLQSLIILYISKRHPFLANVSTYHLRIVVVTVQDRSKKLFLMKESPYEFCVFPKDVKITLNATIPSMPDPSAIRQGQEIKDRGVDNSPDV